MPQKKQTLSPNSRQSHGKMETRAGKKIAAAKSFSVIPMSFWTSVVKIAGPETNTALALSIPGYHKYVQDQKKEVIDLTKLYGIKEIVSYKNVKMIFQIMKDPFYTQKSAVIVTLNYADKEKQTKFMKKCIHAPHDSLVYQEWSVSPNVLHLNGNYNAIRSSGCKPEDTAEENMLRGSARFIWCLFLQKGLEMGAFSKKTEILLKALGNFLMTRFQKENSWWNTATDEEIEEQNKLEKEMLSKQVPDLVEFYKKLGFNPIVSEDERGASTERGVLMKSTVEKTLGRVCASKPQK